MALAEKLVKIIRREKKEKNPFVEAPKLFPNTVLPAIETDSRGIKYPTGLPFDIGVSDQGFTLTRQGERFKEEQGIRIFIIDNQSLNKLYSALKEKDDISPGIFYKFLKMYERRNGSKGRYLALSKEGVVQLERERYGNGYTIIVKNVDHPTKEKYETADRTRLEYRPGDGFVERIVERTISWFREKPLDLTIATNDVEALNIKERSEQRGSRKFLKTGGYKDDEITASFERADRENQIFLPNHNTLIIESLRDKMGSSYAQPLNIEVKQDDQGVLVLKLDKISGVDGVSVNGRMYSLDEGKESIEVPLIDKTTESSAIQLFYNSRLGKRRVGLEMNLRNEKGHVIADFISGIAEVPPLPFDATGGLGVARLTEEEEAIAAQKAKIKEKLKNLAKEAKIEKEIGFNYRLFTYEPKPVTSNGVLPSVTYQKGDENRLHAMVEELKRKSS